MAAPMPDIVLDKITKTFDGGVLAVEDISLTIASGEFLVLVGPSGCGKSTLLRMVAGLEPVSEGTISIGGRDVTDSPPRDRDVAMVFQSYALYPHMTVRQNLGYGLKVRRTPKPEIDARVLQVAKVLGLEQLLGRRPAALSGGQRQRVAMGRAMVREPQAFLMDEPLSNLDAKLRVGMRTQLAALHARLRTTTIYVTHDQIEAMTLGQRVAVLREGRIQQVATPQELYARPTNVFVAAFIGSPAMNLVEADVAGRRTPLRRPHDSAPTGQRGPGRDASSPGIRPEAFEDAATPTPRCPGSTSGSRSWRSWVPTRTSCSRSPHRQLISAKCRRPPETNTDSSISRAPCSRRASSPARPPARAPPCALRSTRLGSTISIPRAACGSSRAPSPSTPEQTPACLAVVVGERAG